MHLVDMFGWSCVLVSAFAGVSGAWIKSPELQPFHESRATESTILLAWSQGVHSAESISHYVVSVRWPLTVEPYDYMLQSRPTGDDHYPTARVANREWAKSWSSDRIVFQGAGRQWLFSTAIISAPVGTNMRVFDFKVRAVTVAGTQSAWSAPVLFHLPLSQSLERFNIELIGTGKNNAGYSEISVAGTRVFHQTDLRGLALAVFDRSDFSLVSVATFDVFTSFLEADSMSAAVRACGPDKFIAVVSGYAWEWHLHPSLARMLEVYGAYYVGQWANVFSSPIQSSPHADLAETASDDSFGHPYALFGSAGWGMGNGIESLQLNTGHYLTTGKAERAIIRLTVYYNYMLGRYVVGQAASNTHEYFTKSQMPQSGTVHNPLPVSRVVAASYQIQPTSQYAPYVGNLHKALDYLLEANAVVVLDEFNATNYGFEIVQELELLPYPIVTIVPRATLITEFERVWGGPTARRDPVSGDFLNTAIDTTRLCASALPARNELGSLALCADYADPTKTADVPLLQFAVGMWPTLCHGANPDCSATPFSPPTSSFSMIQKSTYSDVVTVTQDQFLLR